MHDNMDYGQPNGITYEIYFYFYSLSRVSFFKASLHDPIVDSLEYSYQYGPM